MNGGYIHGFSVEEQRRLMNQAEVLAPNVFRGLDFSATRRLLEVGCGVGAEIKLITRRWPWVQVTGVDLSATHLRAAGQQLAPELVHGSVSLVREGARCLPLARGSFDCVLTIWMLEHVADPRAVLAEALRVIRPGGQLVCTEVDNATFGFQPSMPGIAEWWRCFNRFQSMNGGDLFVGRRLHETARALECPDVSSRMLPLISSRREPRRRAVLLAYLRDLLLSGADSLVRSGLADADLKSRVEREFDIAREDTSIEFQYSAVRMCCSVPE